MSLTVLFHYLMLNMFRMLIHPPSGACDLLWIYFMCCIALVRCVLVLRCGSAGVVWYPYAGWSRALLLFTAQHVSNVNTSTFRSLRHIVDLSHVLYCYGSMCVGVTVWFTTSRKLLKMDVLTFETCWAVNSEIIKQVTSSWSIFIQLSTWCTVQ